MIRNLKLLGLAISAMLMLGAMGASTASATEFHSVQSHTILDVAQIGTDVFTTDSGEVQCEEATASGTQETATTTTVTVTPVYSECTATFGVHTTIDVNGCDYHFTTSHNGQTTTTVDIRCPGEKKYIAVTAPGCEVTVPAQSGLGGQITWSNKHPHVNLKITLEGITYEEHKKGFFPTCKNNTVLRHNGVYHGEATISGTDTNKNPITIWATT